MHHPEDDHPQPRRLGRRPCRCESDRDQYQTCSGELHNAKRNPPYSGASDFEKKIRATKSTAAINERMSPDAPAEWTVGAASDATRATAAASAPIVRRPRRSPKSRGADRRHAERGQIDDEDHGPRGGSLVGREQGQPVTPECDRGQSAAQWPNREQPGRPRGATRLPALDHAVRWPLSVGPPAPRRGRWPLSTTGWQQSASTEDRPFPPAPEWCPNLRLPRSAGDTAGASGRVYEPP